MILRSRLARFGPPDKRAAAFVAAWLLVVVPVSAQLHVATIRGVVRDLQRQPIGGATIVLHDLTGSSVRAGRSAADGSFGVDDVAPGAYVIRVQVQGRTVLSQPLVVRGSLPIELELQAGLWLQDEVVVRGDAAPGTVERPWSLSGDAVRAAHESLPSQRLQSTLAGLPGWTVEDNGLLHVRGVDDGLLYVVDGIPVYERLDRLFGVAPNPSGIASIHVINGYIPPEFGWKSGGVVEVRSETGVADRWSGTLDGGIAGFGTRHLSGLAGGPIAASGGLMLTASSEKSSRFLDPVGLENFHNGGRSTTAAIHWTWRPTADVFSASLQGGQSRYDVPHDESQEEAGQDQRQRVSQILLAGSWQRVLSPRTVWQASAYARHSTSTLFGSSADTPVTLEGERRNRRYGALWSLTHQRSRHTLKTGGEASRLNLDERFSFAVVDARAGEEAGLSEGAIAHNPSSPFVFADAADPRLWSVYVQDVFCASNRLTLNFGVRFDSSRMLVPASQWSPRFGAAFQLGNRTIARASYMLLFQPPQIEYLLLASSPQARALSPFVEEEEGGGSSIPPERQRAVDVSVSHELAGGAFGVEAGAWRRHARDIGDPNVFFGTTITVPNSVARQRGWGYELRLDMRPRAGWAGSATYTRASVEQFGPITGGLFLEDEYLEIRDGTRFVPDHDQRHAFTAVVSHGDTAGRWRVSGAFRYQTGTPVGIEEDDVDELAGRPGAEVVDFDTGRVRARAVADVEGVWTLYRGPRATVSLTAWIANLTNATYAFNFGNPFSGTHFGSPRRAGVSVTARFGRLAADGR